nr:hypothetical protein [Tanacetum cinerariifolium]
MDDAEVEITVTELLVRKRSRRVNEASGSRDAGAGERSNPQSISSVPLMINDLYVTSPSSRSYVNSIFLLARRSKFLGRSESSKGSYGSFQDRHAKKEMYFQVLKASEVGATKRHKDEVVALMKQVPRLQRDPSDVNI